MSDTVQDCAIDRLSDLPADLLVDSLLPACSPTSLVTLAATSHQWRSFISSEGGPCEILWQRRIATDFHFPMGSSGRRTGWFALYRRLFRSASYVWGQNDNGRLALPEASFRIPTSIRSRLIQGGISIPTRLELPAPPIALVAGGWSFHALTAEGQVVSWGALDGESFAAMQAPLSDPGRALRPTVLPQCEQMGELVQLEAGRRHILMRGRDGKVWEMHSYGRAVSVSDDAGRWGESAVADGTRAAAIKAVQAGWDYSAVLTMGGDVFVWLQTGPAVLERAAAQAGEQSLRSFSSQGVAFQLEMDTLGLPSLPSSSSFPDDKIEVIACGDNFILALTAASQLFYLDLSPIPQPNRPFAGQGARNDPEDSPIRSRASRERLEAEFVAGRRAWKRMTKFCDIDELKKLDGLDAASLRSSTRITHISAQFRSFAAYSVPSTSDTSESVVLLGTSDWREDVAPQVIPGLQGLGVIKISHGDYHDLALTSSGHLYSWGAFSAGALGLGHPQLSNTPLSALAVPAAADPPLAHAVNPAHPFPPAQRAQPPGFFPGFLLPRPAARPPPPPQRVDEPTRIRFHNESATTISDEAGRKGKFVYAVAAAGWHSGCLAVDLSDDAAATNEEQEPVIRPQSELEAEAEREGPRGARTVQGLDRQGEDGAGGTHGVFNERASMGRMGRSLRIGFAARGAARGAAGGMSPSDPAPPS
ncbi:hypothetical protein JCM11641_000708 [Rhodosporidiobolus odoratus]